jgi:D-tagatose-1,6-bisphosphate aldolase subunit GatZ/KbaZ
MLISLREQHLSGRVNGQVAVCSAHPRVLRAAATMAGRLGALLLIEATPNQVNLSGGYTGLTPAAFAADTRRLAAGCGVPPQRLVLGADHLGPYLWRRLPAAQAMAQAEALTRASVAAGYQKLHLDTGWGCADDPVGRLPVELTARRAAALCRVAESTARHAHQKPPLYVIGTEVPAPGGALAEDGTVAVTDPQHLRDELAAYEKAFRRAGTEPVWERVLAVVVQPGVDFGDTQAAAYRPEAAAALSAFHTHLPGAMIFEIHACDYQTPPALLQMVRDHFILLKIGPCLTYALRQALFDLARIEAALPELERRSDLITVMEQLMLARPEYWQTDYRGSEQKLRDLRCNSLRDRIRYYWSDPRARQACDLLTHNLRRPIARPLVHRFLPDLEDAVAAGTLIPTSRAVIQARIEAALTPYFQACHATPHRRR